MSKKTKPSQFIGVRVRRETWERLRVLAKADGRKLIAQFDYVVAKAAQQSAPA